MLQIFWFSCGISATHAASGDVCVTNHTVMPLNKKEKRANWVPCSPNNGVLKDDIINTLQLKSCKKSSLLFNLWKIEFLKAHCVPLGYCQVDTSSEGYATVKAQIRLCPSQQGSGNSHNILLNIRAYVLSNDYASAFKWFFIKGFFIFREWILSTSEKHGAFFLFGFFFKLEEIPILQSLIDAGNMSW